MLKHRYFDATRFNIVSPLTLPVEDVVNIAENYKIEPDSVPVPIEEPVAREATKPKGKPGRKPKPLTIDTTVEF